MATLNNLCVSARGIYSHIRPGWQPDARKDFDRRVAGAYNGENRPVSWTCGSTNIVMKFDRMGRRVEYVETVGGTTNTHHRFVYDGYLCVQQLDAANNNAVDLAFGWDPTEPVATRPLVLQKYGQYSMFYTHDGNKNMSELVFFQQANGIAAYYEYAPFGAVTAATRSTPVTAYDFREYNPFRFSSEYADDLLELMYYNYRHYDLSDVRWLGYENEELVSVSINEYLFLLNNSSLWVDYLGMHTSSYYNKYNNPTYAVRRRGRHINPRAKRMNREFCGCVCKICEKGKWKYFTTQTMGNLSNCQPSNAPCPSDSIWVASWHTHGGNDPRYDNENFSNDDKDYAKFYNIDLYLITPGDQFKQYIPGEGEINRGRL